MIRQVCPGGALDVTSSSYDVKEFLQDPRFRTLKTQAEDHWKAFRPKIFKSLQQQGQLEAALDEAAVKALRTQDAYLAEGYPEDGAWEAARQHIFLDDETDENSENYDFEAEWLAQKECEGAMFSLPNGRCVSAEELESGLEEWQFTGNQPGDVIDGPFIYQDAIGGVHAIRVISLRGDEVGTEVWNGNTWQTGGSLSQAVQARAPWAGELAHFGIEEKVMNNSRTEFSPSGNRHHHSLTEIEGIVRRTTSFIALTCITARLLVYPLDAISWHVFRRNFNLPRTYQHALDTLSLISLSAAAVLSLAALCENRRVRQWAGSRISNWKDQFIRATRLLLAMLAVAALVFLCWWIWGEAIKDWLLPIQVHHS